MPQVVSSWWTKEWKELRGLMGWREIKFNQGDFVEGAMEVPDEGWWTFEAGGTAEVYNPLAKARDDGAMVNSKLLMGKSQGHWLLRCSARMRI